MRLFFGIIKEKEVSDMFVMPYVLLIPYAVLLIIYLVFEQKRNFKVATGLKLCLSLFFTMTAWAAIASRGLKSGMEAAPVLISIGLIFSIFGDYFLQYIKKDLTKYKRGIAAFAVSQAFYIAAAYVIFPGGFIRYIILVGLLILALALMRSQNWDTQSHFKHLGIYTVLLALMCGSFIEVAINLPSLWILAAGGILFFVSDMILGIWNYHSGKMYQAHLNWITYFTGQLFIAFGVWALLA